MAATLSRLPGSPIRLPRVGERMKILYLTHLGLSDELDASGRVLALRALVDRALERRGDAHFVALPEIAQFPLGRALQPYIVQSIPITEDEPRWYPTGVFLKNATAVLADQALTPSLTHTSAQRQDAIPFDAHLEGSHIARYYALAAL